MAYYVICDDDCKYEGMTKEEILTAIEQGLAQGYVSDPDSAVFSKIKEICANAATQIWIGTEAKFNALSPAPSIGKSVVRVGSDGVLYLCSDDSTLNDLSEHLNNKNNPHGVTFNQVIGSDVVPIKKGGTDSTTPEGARSKLGITPENIGALPASGGKMTGFVEVDSGNYAGMRWYCADGARFNLRAIGQTNVFQLTLIPNGGTEFGVINVDTEGNVTLSGALPISSGGTGATTASGALTNLGVIYSASEPDYVDGGIWLKPV